MRLIQTYQKKVVLLALLGLPFLSSGLVAAKELRPKRLKGRKLQDTIYNWQQFDGALAAERKKDEEQSQKHCAKIAEKYGITCTPSAQPSSAPSTQPSVSMAPTISSAPSVAPSVSPTKAPTKVPSKSPSLLPSFSPSQNPTAQPSIPPTTAPTTLAPTATQFETLYLTRDDGSLWQDNTCETALPAGATQPQTEETQFEYFLQLAANADPDANLQQVEQALATAMAREMLNCAFDGTSSNPFETYGITSLPVDERGEAGACPEDVQMEGADCYVIRGGFTPTIFYLDRRRRLSFHRSSTASASQSDIIGVFGPVLQQLLDSDAFVGGDVLKTSYSGFLVGDAQGNSGTDTITDIPGVDTNPTTTVALQGDDSSSSNNDGGGSSNQTGFVIGAIAICLAIIAFIVVSAVVLQRRKDTVNKRDFELCDEGELNLEDAIEIDTEALPDKYDTRSVLQEGFPGDTTRYSTPEGIEEAESVHSRSGQFGRASMEESSVEAQRAVRGLKYSVVNDEATFDASMLELDDLDTSAGNDPHDYTNCKSPTCFKCRSKKLPQPTFVQADLQAVQMQAISDLGCSNKYRPKHDRKYAADDTVNL